MSFAFSVNFSDAQITGVDGVADRAEYALPSPSAQTIIRILTDANCIDTQIVKASWSLSKHHENMIGKKYGKLGELFFLGKLGKASWRRQNLNDKFL